MTDVELGRIGLVVQTWPVFQDFDPERLVAVAQQCQKRLQEEGGVDAVMALAGQTIPLHLHDTAYAAAFEVATVDLEMRMEERRVLQLLRRDLAVDDEVVAAIQRAAKARHRTLT